MRFAKPLEEDASMTLRTAAMALLVAMVVQPLQAGDRSRPQMVISEAEARMISEITYTELLGQALSKGWQYTPEQIENGYRRHFEEFKLQLIDQGYTILVGEAGA
jgi:hypothetical protein